MRISVLNIKTIGKAFPEKKTFWIGDLCDLVSQNNLNIILETINNSELIQQNSWIAYFNQNNFIIVKGNPTDTGANILECVDYHYGEANFVIKSGYFAIIPCDAPFLEVKHPNSCQKFEIDFFFARSIKTGIGELSMVFEDTELNIKTV